MSKESDSKSEVSIIMLRKLSVSDALSYDAREACRQGASAIKRLREIEVNV